MESGMKQRANPFSALHRRMPKITDTLLNDDKVPRTNDKFKTDNLRAEKCPVN